jgi:hypothetical protein
MSDARHDLDAAVRQARRDSLREARSDRVGPLTAHHPHRRLYPRQRGLEPVRRPMRVRGDLILGRAFQLPCPVGAAPQPVLDVRRQRVVVQGSERRPGGPGAVRLLGRVPLGAAPSCADRQREVGIGVLRFAGDGDRRPAPSTASDRRVAAQLGSRRSTDTYSRSPSTFGAQRADVATTFERELPHILQSCDRARYRRLHPCLMPDA